MIQIRAHALAVLSALALGILTVTTFAADAPSIDLTNAQGRDTQSLNGKWQIIVDPLSRGDSLSSKRAVTEGYFNDRRPSSDLELVEYAFHESQQLAVPGDWNTQDPTLFFYDRTIWYQRNFTAKKKEGTRQIIYFGGANYRADIYLNGVRVGSHEGGFTPFGFDVTDWLNNGENSLVVKVNSQNDKETVPALDVDWLNYGGLTRDVSLVSVPSAYVTTYFIRLSNLETGQIKATFQTEGASGQQLTLAIPELDVEQIGTADGNGRVTFEFLAQPTLWAPKTPKLYEIEVSLSGTTIRDRVGFRFVETNGRQIVLNGNPVYLRGIGLHDETTLRPGRARNKKDANTTLGLVKELGANFVRLAHYPHNEHIIRRADELGLLVWAEIPVSETTNWQHKETLQSARQQLRELLFRDRNRAAVIIWSIAGETNQGDERSAFLKQLASDARALDDSRLLTATLRINESQFIISMKSLILSLALARDDITEQEKQELGEWAKKQGISIATSNADEKHILIVDDPISEYLDILGLSEYLGWYGPTALARTLPLSEGIVRKITLEALPNFRLQTKVAKPLIISAFGAGAKAGFPGNADTLWSEAYQARVFQQQIAMLSNSTQVQGMSPWILKDFRSAMRPLSQIQDYWNRKGLVDETGVKKAAFEILKAHYQSLQTTP